METNAFISIPERIKNLEKIMPNKTCVEFEDFKLSYSMLNKKSSCVAANIKQLIGEQNEIKPIAILLNHTAEVYYTEIAAMKLGIPYLPLSTDYPVDRLKACIEDANCCLLITSEDKVDEYSKALQIKVCSDKSITKDCEFLKNEACIGPDTPTLIIYTSGSTGKPKGMMHTHQSILDLIDCNRPDYQIGLLAQKFSNMLAMTKISFIAALYNYMAICNGSTAQIPSDREFLDYRLLCARVKKNNITRLFVTPSSLRNIMDDENGRELLKQIKVIVIGGEKNKKSIMDHLFSINSDITLINTYGCSETCGPCISSILRPDSNELIVGKPVFETEILIVDSNKNILPNEEKGEVVIIGSRVVKDYIGHAAGKGSFAKVNGKNAFFTGDVGMIAKDGNLYLFGRTDDMVKFHGQRIELGDIESIASQFTGMGVCKALVMNKGKDDYLGLFFKANTQLDTKKLKCFISDKLPSYMVPGMLLQIDDIPLTSSGKIDRLKLVEKINEERRNFDLPQTDTEKIITDIFSKALGIEQIGVNDDLFQMGGSSLTIASVVSQLGEVGIEVRFGDVNANSTARELAAFCDNRSNTKYDLEMNKERYPLTKTQYGVYLEVKLGVSPQTYSIPYIMKASDDVSAQQLVNAVKIVIDAHPGMKYVIREDVSEQKPYMYVDKEMEFDIPVYEGKASDRLEFIKTFGTITSLEDTPLFNFAVYKTENCCYLMMKTHMIFQDATSTTVLIKEINRVLRSEAPLGEKYCIQQEGLYEEQRKLLGHHEESENYYRNLFHSMNETTTLMGDLNNPLTPGVSLNLTYATDELSSNEVRTLCNKLHISESSFFSSALGILLGKYLFKDKVSCSFVFNGRTRADLADSIGTYIKRLPMFFDISEDQTCEDFLQKINNQMLKSMAYNSYGFDEALKNLPINEDVEFLFQGKTFTDDINKTVTSNKIIGDPYFVENYHTGMITGCLSIALFSSNDKYSLHVEFRNERFSEQWVKDFSRRFFMVAQGLLKEKQISEISIMSDEEHHLIEQSNDTSVEIPFKPVFRTIHEFAQSTPDKVAVICRNRKMTYKELDKQSNSVCSSLNKLGVKRGDFIGVLLDRETDVYSAEIGILKAGCAFVPFAWDCPIDRLSFCINDANIKVIITSKKKNHSNNESLKKKCRFLNIEELLENISDETIEFDCNENDLAYAIYTSGSTGTPKGVMIEHKSLSNYTNRNSKSIEIMYYGEANRVCLALASFSFDVSIVEAFVPLCNGATVCIATEEEIHDPFLLAELIKKEKIDTITLTPTYLQNIVQIEPMKEALARVTLYDIGAEAFIPKLYENLKAIRKDCVILNVYGPTECTMGCTAAEITNGEYATVGKPNSNTHVYVFDTFGKELPPGIRGELVISGKQVARGYINRKEKEKVSFFEYKGEKAYRSGDISSWNEDGNLQIHGRIDSQVKLHGFRIELDEIANKINSFDGISNCAIIIRNYHNSQVLVAFYISEKGINDSLLKSYLQQKLPHYMIPSFFVQLDSFPLTLSGKIDTRQLQSFEIPEKEKIRKEPTTEKEIILCRSFAKALSLPEDAVGINDDFFALGGNSLSAIAVVGESQSLGITVADIYAHKTVEKILKCFDSNRMAFFEEVSRINEQAKKESVELTPFQIVYFDTALKNYKSNNLLVTGLNKMSLEIDAERLCMAVNKTIHHLSVFGSIITINTENGKFCFEYHPELIKDISVEYVSEEQLKEIKKTLEHPFGLVGKLLYQIRIFKTESNVYLFISMHLILVDGNGLEPLHKNFYLAYHNQKLLPDYYYYFLHSLSEKLKTDFTKKARRYYQRISANGNWAKEPIRDLNNNFFGVGEYSPDNGITIEQLRNIEKRFYCSATVIAIMATSKAICKEDNFNDILIQWFNDNRSDETRNDIVGELANTQPLFLHMKSFKGYFDLSSEINKQMIQNRIYGDYFYDNATYVPYYGQSMFVNYLGSLLKRNASEITFNGTFVPVSDGLNYAGLNFMVYFMENEKTLDFRIEYNNAFYSKEKINRIGEYISQELKLMCNK